MKIRTFEILGEAPIIVPDTQKAFKEIGGYTNTGG